MHCTFWVSCGIRCCCCTTTTVALLCCTVSLFCCFLSQFSAYVREGNSGSTPDNSTSRSFAVTTTDVASASLRCYRQHFKQCSCSHAHIVWVKAALQTVKLQFVSTAMHTAACNRGTVEVVTLSRGRFLVCSLSCLHALSQYQ